ncbi:MAG: glucosaminidase domain-containing protein, partial [Bacteroidaceae bacterium]|nr:glucosaminidase domain-containing protein [Bacteroidaceae bacterium]
MKSIRFIFLICSFAVSCLSYAQRNAVYQQYIDLYSDMAIDQMRRYKIPASITMAQAILESGAGRSYLATKANNHFGIKVSSGWNGGYVTRDDDRKNERFRKYKNVEDSYEDHSKFLLKDRYKRLFDLDPLDYKGWARGLKACGYATLPTYANRLIDIIETYELHELDEDRHGLKRKKKKKEIEYVAPQKHIVMLVNGKQCVVARQGDTWESIAKELKVSKRKLLKYNEMMEDYALP